MEYRRTNPADWTLLLSRLKWGNYGQSCDVYVVQIKIIAKEVDSDYPASKHRPPPEPLLLVFSSGS